MKSGVYQIFNLITGMFYIGRALNFDKRWKNHLVELRLNRHVNPYLQSAYNKYGEAAFEFQIVEYCDPGIIIDREQYWLDFTECYNRNIGYNLSQSAEGTIGVKASDETKAKLSALRIGKPRSEETIAKIKATMKGRQFSPETREKMRQAQLGKKKSEATKNKMSWKKVGNQNSAGSIRSKEHLEAMFRGRFPLDTETKPSVE